MFHKNYAFSGCSVELISDTPVYDSALFANFRDGADTEERLVITVIHSELPERVGVPVFSDETSAYHIENGKGYYFTFYPSETGTRPLACRVTQNEEITLLVVPGQKLWDSLVAFAVNYTQLLLYRGFATLHSSCVEVNGKALLFAGNKGVGKSTQAALWNRFRGARIINGDRIAVKPDKTGLTAYGIPFCGSSAIALHETLAVKAIVLPVKAETQTVSRLSPFDAFKAVLGNLTYNVEDISQLDPAIGIAERIAKEVPVYRLLCVPEKSAVEILEEELCRI